MGHRYLALGVLMALLSGLLFLNLWGIHVPTARAADLEPGEVYYFEISESETSIDRTVSIWVPENGLFMLTVETFITGSLSYPLPRTLEIELHAELYREGTLIQSGTVKVTDDQIGGALIFDHLFGPHSYTLRVYGDRLRDEIDSSYIRFDLVLMELSEGIDMVMLLSMGFGQTLPQYIYGTYTNHVAFIRYEPKSSYDEWPTDVPWIILNTHDMLMSFYRDFYAYDEDLRCYEFVDQYFVELPAKSGKIIRSNFKPRGRFFDVFWTRFDEDVFIPRNFLLFLYPFQVEPNIMASSSFASWLPYDVHINIFSFYFEAKAHRRYLVFSTSTANTDLLLCTCDEMETGELISIANRSSGRVLHLLPVEFECDKYVIPALLWLEGETSPDFELGVCELEEVAEPTSLLVNVDSVPPPLEDELVVFSWARAFKVLDDLYAIFENAFGSQVEVLHISGATLDKHVVEPGQVVRLSLSAGDMLLLKGRAPGQGKLSFTKGLVGLSLAPLSVDLTGLKRFNVTLSVANYDVIEHEVSIKVTCPGFLKPLNKTSLKIEVPALGFLNMTFLFDVLRLSTGFLNFTISYDGEVVERGLLLTWNYSAVEVEVVPEMLSFKAGHQSKVRLRIHNPFKVPCVLYVAPEIIGFEIRLSGPEVITAKPGLSEVEYVIESDIPGEATLRFNLFADEEKTMLLSSQEVGLKIEWSTVERLVLELFGYRISLGQARLVVKLGIALVPIVIRCSKKVREKMGWGPAILLAIIIFAGVSFAYIQFRDALDFVLDLIS